MTSGSNWAELFSAATQPPHQAAGLAPQNHNQQLLLQHASPPVRPLSYVRLPACYLLTRTESVAGSMHCSLVELATSTTCSRQSIS